MNVWSKKKPTYRRTISVEKLKSLLSIPMNCYPFSLLVVVVNGKVRVG